MTLEDNHNPNKTYLHSLSTSEARMT